MNNFLITKKEKDTFLKKWEQRVKLRNQRSLTENQAVKNKNAGYTPKQKLQQKGEGKIKAVNWDIIDNLPHNIEVDNNY